MDEIWMRMASRYGHAWVSQYGPLPDGIAAAEWADTLAGLTRGQIQSGFRADKLRGADWPPSSTRFRTMCFGIPTIAEVRHLLHERSTTPFVRQVWGYIDRYRFKQADHKEGDRLLADAYALARENVLLGVELPPDPVAMIDAPKSAEFTPASPEAVAAAFAKIGAMLGAAA